MVFLQRIPHSLTPHPATTDQFVIKKQKDFQDRMIEQPMALLSVVKPIGFFFIITMEL